MVSVPRIYAFYNYGRARFTQKGLKKAKQLDTDNVDIRTKKFLVTGANSGIGKCLVYYLYSKGARVYMVCRNGEKAEAVRKQIIDLHTSFKADDGDSIELSADQLRIIVADVSRRNDVERCISELTEKWKESSLDCALCNAGAMATKLQLTSDGVEKTFACQFLFGVYWYGLYFCIYD